MGKIKFGTDGWRAVISDEFTFENVKIVAQAMADYIKSQKFRLRQGFGGQAKIKGKKSELYGKRYQIVIGYDTRFMSEKYAELMASVFAGNGIKVILADRPTPTPSVSFNIKKKNLFGGVMITASHNPAPYNGIKYKCWFGGSAGKDVTDSMEKSLYRSKVKFLEKGQAIKKGLFRMENIIPFHLKFIKTYADMKLLNKAGLRILVDSMNGTGCFYIEEILKNSNNKVTTINGERDVYFSGRSPEPNEYQLRSTSQIIKKKRYDLGIVTDGDADRLGVILPSGKVLSGHKVMTLLLLHLLEDRKKRGGIVQTICGTALLDKIASKYRLKVFETPVGFKYIADIFNKENILLGGEETGGVAFKGWLPERDGILSGLLIIEMMAFRKKALKKILDDVEKEYGSYIYKRYDLYYPVDRRKKLAAFLKKRPFSKILDKRVISMKSYDGFKFILEDGSWLMLRPSGTEPKLRVYSEGRSEKEAVKLVEFGKKFASGI